jgi:hypothetical protein
MELSGLGSVMRSASLGGKRGRRVTAVLEK